jgi:hypothetical protein
MYHFFTIDQGNETLSAKLRSVQKVNSQKIFSNITCCQ